MVEDDLVTQKFLELPEKAGCEAGLVFQMISMEPPLVLEEGFQVLCERKEVSGLAGVKGAVHIGCQEYAEVRW